VEDFDLRHKAFKTVVMTFVNLVNLPVVRFWYGLRLKRMVERTAPGCVRIHFACGKRPFAGWINIDYVPYSPGPDVLLDLRRPLPLRDNTVDLMYSEDFIEHVDLAHGRCILREWYRLLRPGGALRLLTPNLRVLATKYVERSTGFLEWYSHHWGTGSFAEILNHGMRSWGHLFLYDDDLLTREFVAVGFSPQMRSHNQSDNPLLCGLDRPDSQEAEYRMYFDCIKPHV
jgi:predicted SAM-dependent methyltransferase